MVHARLITSTTFNFLPEFEHKPVPYPASKASLAFVIASNLPLVKSA